MSGRIFTLEYQSVSASSHHSAQTALLLFEISHS